MPDQFAFVVVGDSGRTKSADRSLIRSRCMQGKNRQEGSRRSLQAARKAMRAAGPRVAEHERNSRPEPVATKSPHGTVLDKRRRTGRRSEHVQEELEDTPSPAGALLPPPLASPNDMSLIRFADELEKPSQEILFKMFNSTALQETVYPIEHIVDLPRAPNSQALSVSWILQDKIYLHSVLFYSFALQDRVLHHPPGRTTQFHLRRTITLLNMALSKKDSHLYESILHVILNLALMAGAWGDFVSTAVHLSGLQQIVRLRGGLEYLRRNPKMYFKLDRLALTLYLGAGGAAPFFPGPVTWNPCFQPPLNSHPIQDDFFKTIADPRLAVVFHDLQHLVGLVNDHLDRSSRLGGLLFQDSLSSIQNRLVQLQGGLDEPLDECLRLGMLAFLSTTLRIPGGRFPYTYLEGRFRSACQTFITRTAVDEHIVIWLLIIGSISVFEASETWLQSFWSRQESSRLSWEEVRSRLQAVMWIDRLHGKLGRETVLRLSGLSGRHEGL